MKKTMKKTISLLVLMSIAMTLILPAQHALAADPYIVDGRVLSAVKAGDSSEWVEIAKYSNFSLILRKEVIGQSAFGPTQQYNESTVRNVVNTWFKSTLGSGARMRNFTSKSNALSQLGNWANVYTGFSTPGTATGTGDDVAFLLSFAEAALFCSTQYVSSNGATYLKSSDIAIKNFEKLAPIPLYAQPYNHWWLRTPGGTNYRACTIGLGGFDSWGLDMRLGSTNQYERDSNIINVRPALWVNSSIFDADVCTISYDANNGTGAPPSHTAQINTSTYLSSIIPTRTGYTFQGWGLSPTSNVVQYQPSQYVYITANLPLYAVWLAAPATRTVTGYVWPMVTRELTTGFKAKHDITIELRPTFRVQAPASRTTKAVLIDDDGLGQFTIPDVPYGTYILYIYRPGYLIRCMEVTISASSPSTVALAPPGTADKGVFNLWWGDVNGDYSVDNFDVMILLTHMANGVSANHIAYDAATDMNADGRPDNGDIMLVLNMWGKTIRNYAGAEYINYYI